MIQIKKKTKKVEDSSKIIIKIKLKKILEINMNKNYIILILRKKFQLILYNHLLPFLYYLKVNIISKKTPIKILIIKEKRYIWKKLLLIEKII